jgi:hypothetical protein
LKPNRKRKQDLSEREKKIHQSERGQREGEIKRELLQVVAQPNPIGFLP